MRVSLQCAQRRFDPSDVPRGKRRASHAPSQPRRRPPWRRRLRWKVCAPAVRSRRRGARVLFGNARPGVRAGPGRAMLRALRRANRPRPARGSTVAAVKCASSATAASGTFAGVSSVNGSRGCKPISARKLRKRSEARCIASKAAAASRIDGDFFGVGPRRRHDRLSVVRNRQPDFFGEERFDRMQQSHRVVPHERQHRGARRRDFHDLRRFEVPIAKLVPDKTPKSSRQPHRNRTASNRSLDCHDRVTCKRVRIQRSASVSSSTLGSIIARGMPSESESM